MKAILLYLFILTSTSVKAQKIDSICVHLYTDSLKKGSYNYINIDGLLSNGRYLPLDSTHLHFSASAGTFYGNDLWIDNNFSDKKISIKVALKNNPFLYKEFDVYIKQTQDDQRLKTTEEILEEMKRPNKKSRPSS